MPTLPLPPLPLPSSWLVGLPPTSLGSPGGHLPPTCWTGVCPCRCIPASATCCLADALPVGCLPAHPCLLGVSASSTLPGLPPSPTLPHRVATPPHLTPCRCHRSCPTASSPSPRTAVGHPGHCPTLHTLPPHIHLYTHFACTHYTGPQWGPTHTTRRPCLLLNHVWDFHPPMPLHTGPFLPCQLLPGAGDPLQFCDKHAAYLLRAAVRCHSQARTGSQQTSCARILTFHSSGRVPVRVVYQDPTCLYHQAMQVRSTFTGFSPT